MKKNANLGKQLEDKIIKENAYLHREGIAVVKKIPNNWVVQRKGPHIVGANPVPSGLCDFIGTSKLIKGRTFVFDAKETKLKTRFPLKNIKPSQMDHMADTIEHGGIGFLIIWFTEINESYLIPYKQLLPFWKDAEDDDNPQSIPLLFFRENCFRLIDYDYFNWVQKQ